MSFLSQDWTQEINKMDKAKVVNSLKELQEELDNMRRRIDEIIDEEMK